MAGHHSFLLLGTERGEDARGIAAAEQLSLTEMRIGNCSMRFGSESDETTVWPGC
jgi:hypothetical protein